MCLLEVYSRIKPAIVAFCAKYSHDSRYADRGRFPHIIGTGFVIDSCGLILTNQHVVDEFEKQTRKSLDSHYLDSVGAVLFDTRGREIRYPGLEIEAHTKIASHIPQDEFFDQEPPDIALVAVKVKDLPSCTIQTSPNGIREGLEVGTAGFPMGTLGLTDTPNGRIRQLSPVLQRGIISAIQPWAVDTPLSFTINVLIQSGASGSPVFDTQTGEVMGVLSARRVEPRPAAILDGKGRVLVDDAGKQFMALVEHPTSFSVVVPTYRIADQLPEIKEKLVSRIGNRQISLEEYYSSRPGKDFIKGEDNGYG